MYIINLSNCHEGNNMEEDSEFILVPPFPSSDSTGTKEEKKEKEKNKEGLHVIDNPTAAADDDVTDGSKDRPSWKESAVRVFFPMIVCWVLAHFVLRRRS